MSQKSKRNRDSRFCPAPLAGAPKSQKVKTSTMASISTRKSNFHINHFLITQLKFSCRIRRSNGATVSTAWTRRQRGSMLCHQVDVQERLHVLLQRRSLQFWDEKRDVTGRVSGCDRGFVDVLAAVMCWIKSYTWSEYFVQDELDVFVSSRSFVFIELIFYSFDFL